MANVKITRLEKNYAGVPAVRGIDLEIADGEFTVLVGPSGCGKRTLLRTLAGLEAIAAGAIVRNPRDFLFDEPLSNLDAQLRDEMRGEIKRLHQELGTTMIYVTHDQIEAMTLADRIVLLKDGLIEQAGSPLDLYERPATRFVAGILGSPKMNFIPGEYMRDGSGAAVK